MEDHDVADTAAELAVRGEQCRLGAVGRLRLRRLDDGHGEDVRLHRVRRRVDGRDYERFFPHSSETETTLRTEMAPPDPTPAPKDVEALQERLRSLLSEREELRSAGADRAKLEDNRRAIVNAQWDLSARADRTPPPDLPARVASGKPGEPPAILRP